MTPAVRRLLREHGLSPEQIRGTGGGGRITRDDVLAVVEAIRTGGARARSAVMAPAAAPRPPRPAGDGPGRRRAIAFPRRRRRGPPADDPDAQGHRGPDDPGPRGPARLRPHGGRRERARARPRGAPSATTRRARASSLSYVPFVIKAAVEALKQHPTFNAHWTDAGHPRQAAHQHGRRGRRRRRAHRARSSATSTSSSISGLNRAIADVAARARAGKLRLDDFGGSTFTIDNTGWFGSNLTMPIINVPEVAILTMEAITKRPVVLETPEGDVIAIRPIMNMVLAIDHRANDGAQAAAFLRVVKAALEADRDPTRQSTDAMRVVVTGAAGFIGRAVVRQLAARGRSTSSRSSAIRRPPTTWRPRPSSSSQSDLSDVATLTELVRRRRRPHPRRRLLSGRDPGLGAARDARRERRHHRARARRRDRGGRAADRLPLDDQRLRQHARPGRRRDVPARPGGRLRELLRRDEVAGPASRRRSASRTAPRSSSSSRARPTARATTRRSASSSCRPTWARRRSSPSAAWASARSTSTTSRPGSSRPSTAAARAGRTRSAVRTSG